ncbi:LytR C-terminal domain-containing protein [Arthrobacter castelli]|uniref:LytR C-terminal domain-containing protein n=1 Tax=Arthrobacter castelli TaxID=271431 RepID=UPI000415FD31|nr:LytR C-terminal domain-containing protein [Arthrobacter castelli]
MNNSGRKRGLFKRRPKEPDTLHGQKIVTGEELREVFDDGGEAEYLPGYRRRLVHGVVLTVLVAALITAVLLALAIARGELKVPFLQTEAAEPVACPTAVFSYPANENVNISVYNSTNQGGLASGTADKLRKRGYTVGQIGNRSLNNNSGTAVIVSGEAGRAGAYNLQQNIKGTEYVADDRQDDSIDVILGRGFSGLVPAEKVDESAGQLSCPRLSPSPTTTGTGTASGGESAEPTAEHG